MSEISLSAIEARVNAATPGPWKQLVNHVFHPGENGANICSASELRAVRTLGFTEPDISSSDLDEIHANAAFIAAARTDIPALIARVRELETANEKLRNDLVNNCSGASFACEACGALLFSDDDFVSNPDCVRGCWAAMTDRPSSRPRPCYAYRVGKPDASSNAKIERGG